MDDHLLAWVWLSLLLGPCSPKLMPLLALYGGAAEMLEQRESPEFWQKLSPHSQIENSPQLLDSAQRVLLECTRAGVTAVSYDSPLYPSRLKGLPMAPAVLYVTGDPTALNGRCIAGVGTRSISQYGRETVREICEPLAREGVTLVSGLAQGIDAEVHKAALKCGARTVAVMATAPEQTFPAAHAQLRGVIERSGGAAVTEIPPGEHEYSRASFPQRNRIIAGMSMGVMIFEAAMKSGTMITANWALEYSREVMCVPGSILSGRSTGTNYLIKQGAALITCAGDVLETLGLPSKCRRAERTAEAPPQLEGAQLAAYTALFSGAKTLDELGGLDGYSAAQLKDALSELEIDGLVSCVAGSYSIKQR